MRKLLDEVERTISRHRAVKRLLESDQFLAIWERAPEMQNEFRKLADKGDRNGLLAAMGRAGYKISEMSYRQLRELAQRRGVPYWSRLSVYELIQELEKRERKEEPN